MYGSSTAMSINGTRKTSLGSRGRRSESATRSAGAKPKQGTGSPILSIDGTIREKSQDVSTKVTYETSLVLLQVFQRRGVALDVARLISYKLHDSVIKNI